MMCKPALQVKGVHTPRYNGARLTLLILNEQQHLLFDAFLRSLKEVCEIIHVQHVLSQALRAGIVRVSDVFWRIARFPQVNLQIWRARNWVTVGV